MATRRQRWMIGFALFALPVGVLAILFIGGAKEPVYKGKALHVWFDLLDPMASYSAEDPNVRAILAIGPDAVPFLIHELRISDSYWAERSRELWGRLGLVRRPYGLPRDRRLKAFYCLIHLGPKADSALPELISIAQGSAHKNHYHELAILLLGYVQSNPTTAMPVLQRIIESPYKPFCLRQQFDRSQCMARTPLLLLRG